MQATPFDNIGAQRDFPYAISPYQSVDIATTREHHSLAATFFPRMVAGDELVIAFAVGVIMVDVDMMVQQQMVR